MLCVFPPEFLIGYFIKRLNFIEPVGTPPRQLGTILALNEKRYRGELAVLANAGFIIYAVPFELQARLIGVFYENGSEILLKEKSRRTYQQQRKMQYFLSRFIPSLYSRLKINMTISAAVHYKQDYDWGVASQKAGFAYIVLHRENTVAANYQKTFLTSRLRKFEVFSGSKVLVHNTIMRDILIQSGFLQASQTSIIGAARMDSFIKRLSDVGVKESMRKVCFFSFGPGAGLMYSLPPHWPSNLDDKRGFFTDLCYQTHVAIAEFAIENPDVDVVIKPKWGGEWTKNLAAIFNKANIEIDRIPNMKIDIAVDAQDLIVSSDVVVGFASTTLLEALIAGKQVIFPRFAEARKHKFSDYVFFMDDIDVFSVANSSVELKSLLFKSLSENRKLSLEDLEKRKQIFVKYVGPVDGSATGKLISELTLYL